MTRPTLESGANSAERAPTTTWTRPAAREVPLVEALAAGEARVQDGHVVTEAAAEAPHGLGRERDLRHEDDGAAPALAHALDGVEVDLGLSRAVTPSTSTTSRSPRPWPCDGVEGGELAVREMVWPRRGGTRERGGLAGASDASAVLHLDEPALGERRDDRSRARHHGRELGHAHGARRRAPRRPGAACWRCDVARSHVP